MYPLKFENLYFKKVWGSRDLQVFRHNLPDGKIGESWDIACHPHGTSTVANGKYKGMKLSELIRVEGKNLIGTDISAEWFPLLVKLISTGDKLSIQVHPDDEFAMKTEGEYGKVEVWYIISASNDACLYMGTNGCTREQFKEATESGNLDRYINRVPAGRGDVFLIRSGLIHAIGEGFIIAEVQQNSDTTYRVYDFNRGRQLHINKAMDVIDFHQNSKKISGLKIEGNGYSRTFYCVNRHFALVLYDAHTGFFDTSDSERFFIYTCVDGSGEIRYGGGMEYIYMGDSILVPAGLGEYEIMGKLKLLKSYVPNILKVRDEILGVVE